MKRFHLAFLIQVLLAMAGALPQAVLRSEEANPPAPPPPPPVPSPGDRERPPQDGSRRPGPPPRGGMMPGNPGMYPRADREHMDAFSQLPEEERKRVREAFEKVWNKPEMVRAREQLMKANDDYRRALHQALEEVDTGVVKIIEKMKPPIPGGGFPFIARLPDPNDPEFSKKAQERFRNDFQNWARNESRGEKRDAPVVVGRFQERVAASPAVRDLLQQLDAAQEPQRRMDLGGRLREAYQAVWRAEFGGQPRREGPPPGGKPERRDNPKPPDVEKK